MNKKYENISYSEIEKAITTFLRTVPDHDDSEVVDFHAIHRTDEQIDKIVANPYSPFHKILDGYWYHIDGNLAINTGSGGARMMYRVFLKEGLHEDMIESLIYVAYNGRDFVPLKAVNIIKNGK